MTGQSNIQKQHAILDAALQLFVQQGFHGVSTKAIASAAGISNGTLFHYFPTKDELVIGLYHHVKAQMRQSQAHVLPSDSPLKARIQHVFTSALHWALDYPVQFRYLQQFAASPYLHMLTQAEADEATRAELALLEEGVATGMLKAQPLPLLFTLVSSHVFGLNQYLIANPASPTAQQLTISQAFDLLWDMIAIPSTNTLTS